MVELDKILRERSDERIIKTVKDISEQEFTSLVERILGYLELRISKSRARGEFVIADCIHRPDGKRYAVIFSRRDEPVAKGDIESLISYMSRTEAEKGLVLTTSSIQSDGASLAEEHNMGVADGAKLAALLRRFDLDKEVIQWAEARGERLPKPPPGVAAKSLQDAMAEGYQALADKDFVKALDAFDRAILVDESYDVPWRMKGNTLDEMGYHEQALECYRQALELFPESDETWFSLGNCFFALSRYDEELLCYDRALTYNPTMVKALINKGSTLHRLGRYKEALDTYDKVLKINYRLEKVHNNRGATLHSLGKHNEALESYNRAIELKHDYVEGWMNKGNLLYELQRYEEALAAFDEVTRIRPELPKGWYLKGLASRKLGKITQAKAAFEQALRLDPEFHEAKRAIEEESRRIQERFVEVPRIVQDIFSVEAARAQQTSLPTEPITSLPADMVARVRDEKVEELAEEIYGDRAELLFLLGRQDEAIDYLGRSLKLEGESAHLLTASGVVLFKQGKLEASVKSFEHALEVDPKHVPALLNLHTALMQLGDLERASKVGEQLRNAGAGWQARVYTATEAAARNDIKQALDDTEVALTMENLSVLMNYRGLLKLMMGDVDGAIESFERAKVTPLDQSEAYNNLGVAILKKGDAEKASVEFDKAIRLNRANFAAWNNRGCVLYKFDRNREAIGCFEESLIMNPTTVAMTNKGFTQLALDMLQDALQSFEQSLQLSETPEAYNNKGIALARMGRGVEAQVAFREAMRLAPAFKDPESNLKAIPPEALQQKAAPAARPTIEVMPSQPEIVGGKEAAPSVLESMSIDAISSARKSDLVAICESIGISSRGTKTELVQRLIKAKRAMRKR